MRIRAQLELFDGPLQASQLMAAMPTSRALSLHKGLTEPARKRLLERKQALEDKLDVPLGGWHDAAPELLAAQELLRAANVKEAQVRSVRRNTGLLWRSDSLHLTCMLTAAATGCCAAVCFGCSDALDGRNACEQHVAL